MAEGKRSTSSQGKGLRGTGSTLGGLARFVTPLRLGLSLVGLVGMATIASRATDARAILVVTSTTLACGAIWFVHVFLSARRRRADFISGESERVTRAANEEADLGQVPSNYRVLALVGVGDFGAARRALLAGEETRGRDAYEISMCARILIEAFEGEPPRALSLCRDLLQNSSLDDARSAVRRESVVSIARIAAGLADEDDWEGLRRAPIFEPALLWVCRYATVLRRREASLRTHPVFVTAPPWPRESYFFWLQRRLARRSLPSAPSLALV